MRNLIGSVRPSSKPTNSPVWTFLSSLPLSTTSTAAYPVVRPATLTRMRYVWLGSSAAAFVFQLTLYHSAASSSRTLADVAPPLEVKLAIKGVTQAPASTRQTSTASRGPRVGSNVPLNLGCGPRGGRK